MAEKTIKVASFPYRGEGDVEQTALRGDKVNITNDADLQRGERLGAFATDEDLKEDSPFAQFLASREAAAQQTERQNAELAGEPTGDAVPEVQPAAAERQARPAGRSNK